MAIYDIGNVHKRNLPHLTGNFKTTRLIAITKFEFNKDLFEFSRLSSCYSISKSIEFEIMAFRSQLKIRFGDIDRAGIVHYPRFMHYFHVALEEFFAGELEIE